MGGLVSLGHLGTHFDVMDKEFPLAFTRREAVVFDLSSNSTEEIEIGDIDLSLVEPDCFVAFRTDWIERKRYGTKEYLSLHPQLSNGLIDALLEKRVSIIGLDFVGARREPEHTAKDRYCADRGVFIVENLRNLDALTGGRKATRCVINTYPINFSEQTGLPCRVVAETGEPSVSI
ncbi:MAG TPA: cyclase family protein [Rectinemataceae bacterium]|nr:cyclase family protein [Rectinemataceae bacterium]